MFRGFVEVGAEECPNCGMSGALSWIEGEPQEVNLDNLKLELETHEFKAKPIILPYKWIEKPLERE